MIRRVAEWLSRLLDCSHDRLSFPITRGERTYQVCLECGREFDYAGELAPRVPAPREIPAGVDVCAFWEARG